MAKVEEELIRIAKKLDRFVQDKDNGLDPGSAVVLLERLQKMPITLDMIQKTRVGHLVNNLRKKMNDEDVSVLSKSLIKTWKKMLDQKDKKSSSSAAAGGDDSQSASGKTSVSSSSSVKSVDSTSNGSSAGGKNGSGSSNSVSTANSSTLSPSPSSKSSSNVRSSTSSSFPASGAGTISLRQSAYASDTKDEVRLKCREMLAVALKPDAEQESSEDNVFFDSVELAASIENCIYKEFKDTNMKYKNRIRSRVANLKDTKNPDLKLNVLRGMIRPDRIAVMTAEEMASAEMKQLRQKFTKEAIHDAQMSLTGGTKTDLLTCPACKKKNCTYNQVQTRSADEPMTTFCYCNECGKRWKFC